jgi:hypothetical protein
LLVKKTDEDEAYIELHQKPDIDKKSQARSMYCGETSI